MLRRLKKTNAVDF